ncbi:ribonuclease J [Proteiniclasticum sp. SCR006]|uniref:Ribonuclease J n=1 Tax=Proteiniclasticum aestuarii TaxID=2817862 RepID=A0A939KI60_9CLOT|nr:ribonuclease J [Proteiniclasticum aestuarii]MBO1263626.1 ribonuclease J [Proteiniclasticum aestuarii]
MAKEKDNVKIIPLGGTNEIGKNMTVIEYKDEIIVVDSGLKFPDDDMLGIDVVIPDITYLVKNQEKIKGIFITHGHEDHIGALPYVLKQINVPVYATKLTAALINLKLTEHRIQDVVTVNIVKAKDVIKLDKMSVEYIKVNHSIADSCALAIHTPLGAVVHTGDFKIDYTPVDGEVIDLQRFAELGKRGVLALLCDSTNVEREGFTISESSVGDSFKRIFHGVQGRIIISTFASNIHRIQQIIEAGIAAGRKIAVSGRSMENIIPIAIDLGYIHIDEKHLISIDDVKKYPDNQIVIVTTGSQGEPMAALSRMANNMHRKIQVKQGDTVVFSSSPIPGNEKPIFRTIDKLAQLGAEVVYGKLEAIHVSGHACKEEIKLMHTLTKPRNLIPVHGEYRMLREHRDLGMKLGLSGNNIVIPENGDVIEVFRKGIKKVGTVNSGHVLIDGLGVGDVGRIVLRDRKHLSEDGIITVVVTMEKESGLVVAGPDIITRGFVYVKEAEALMDSSRKVVMDALRECEDKHITDWNILKNIIKDTLKNHLFEKTKRRPMILPIIMEV